MDGEVCLFVSMSVMIPSGFALATLAKEAYAFVFHALCEILVSNYDTLTFGFGTYPITTGDRFGAL